MTLIIYKYLKINSNRLVNFFRFIQILFVCTPFIVMAEHGGSENGSNFIEVEKKNILHKFVRFDQPTDHFTQNVFPAWENDTFEVFEYVKDPNGIAIDLGAWIGATTIWLSKNFHHVVAVDADRESIKCLRLNLEASRCSNVTICDKPVMDTSQPVVFGPRGSILNESISYIKTHSDNPLDYIVKSITFKQLIHDTIYANDELSPHKISFIKCDIESGEENILEDVLHFAFYNKCPVYMSFHISWWTSKKITDFDYLFEHFDVGNASINNISGFLQNNPFSSLLLIPKKDEEDLIKQNVTSVIIGYNQYTYIKNMVSQLEKYTKDIVIIDNNSTYQPLIDYYNNEFKYSLLKQKMNYGYTVYQSRWVKDITGNVYILTDPDLQFNKNLPREFIRELINLSNYFRADRVGFALFIDSDDIREDITHVGFTIKEWENQFWQHRLPYPLNSNLELYSAPIDTTFCLINRKHQGNNCIRVAGDYTCIHIPWHINFQIGLQENEYESYLNGNVSTNWYKLNK